jgi:choice-of-anchor C domain-containing protein
MNSFIRKANRLVLLGAVTCLGVASSHGVPIIMNGSFESAPGGSYPIYPGSTSLTGWTIESGSVDSVDSFQTHDGIMCVDLDGYYQAGAMSQTVNTTPGASYLLSFWMAGNPAGVSVGFPAVKAMRLSWGGVSQGIFSFDTTGKTESNMGWVQHQLVVQATGSQMNLRFASLDALDSAFGPMLDDVSLTPVPEPSSACLLVGGVAMFFIRKNGCRKK